MKVAILKSRLGHEGGLERQTILLAHGFVKAKCTVTMLTTSPSPGNQYPFDIMTLCPSHPFSYLHYKRFDRECRKWLKDHPQTIVFGMERNSFQTHYRAGNGVHAAYLRRRRVFESGLKSKTFFLNPLHRSLLASEKKGFEDKDLKLLFVNSQMVYEEVLEHYPKAKHKLRLVHNGIDLEAFHPVLAETKHLNPFHFLFIGNGYQRKGLKFLLQGLSLLPKEDWRLTVVGKDKDIPYFQRMASNLGLDASIHFCGPQTDLIPFYQEADALVIPSIYDPFANVTLEALAMGLYVVSSRYNGGHEILNSSTGEVIQDLSSPDSVAEALKQALLHPKTANSMFAIRNSVKGLEFSKQLDTIMCETFASLEPV